MDSREDDIAWLKSTFHPIPKPVLLDDCIEYSLYLIDRSLDQSDDSETKLKLREVQKYATNLQKLWVKDYIWQRQPFQLETKLENGLSFLQGRTEYGDSIEDEWVVVWLLRELTKHFPESWVKVTDSDGEFLLIEASETLPAWLEPEVAENRVWINNGQLKIIKPAGSSRSSKHTDEKLALEEAHAVIRSEPKRIMHSTMMEEEAFYRLRNYPDQIRDNMHHAMMRLPRKVAYLLLQKPAYVAPAIEAFYLRDPIALKPLHAKDAANKLIFFPDDLVDISVKFPRVAYAQLKSQDFPLLDIWKAQMPSPTESDARARTETGMKLTCGFEILLSDAHYQDRSFVREMMLLLEDLESGDETLPSNEDLDKLEKRADDEKWMDISFDDLQAELNRGQTDVDQKGTRRKAQFGDKAAQENLQRIVKQFEAFLNDKNDDDADVVGDENEDDRDLDDIDSEDLEEDMNASFAEDEFTKLIEEAMGLPPEVMEEIRKGDIDAFKNGARPRAPAGPDPASRARQDENMEPEAELNEQDIEELMRKMGAELKDLGAFDSDITEAGPSGKPISNVTDIGDELSSDDEDLLIDGMNQEFAKNLLESFRSQSGGAGPASNLMAMMTDMHGPSVAERSITPKNNSKGKQSTRAENPRRLEELTEDVD